MKFIKRLWQLTRRLSGDDAYERYIQHYAEQPHDESPLTRDEFFKQWQEKKWSGVKRCC